MYKYIATVSIVFISYLVEAATITATSSGGRWTNASTWVGGVVPSDGDIAVIPSGSVVTIRDQFVTFNGTLNIYGTLRLLDFGGWPYAELDMDASGVVNILSGGQITSGGSGYYEWYNGIVIGSNYFAYWPGVGAGSDPQTGPVTMDVTTTSGPMPVELLFFNAKVVDEQVELTWATASEENFDYFSIERSVNGKDFKEIAQVTGMGTSNTKVNYNYADEFPLIGRAYYRLKSVDFDGYTEVFDYVMVEYDGTKKDFTIYPNPVTNNQFSLKTNYEVTEDQSLIVYNSMGTVEKTYTVNNWLSEFNTDDLMPGSYLVKLVSSSGTIVKRILIK